VRALHASAAFLCAIAAISAAIDLRDASPSVDELYHVVRGLSYWWTGDTRLSCAHPPLANALAAAPGALWFWGQHPVLSSLPGWSTSDPKAIADAYAALDYEQLRAAWLLSRATLTAATIAFFAYLYVWVGRRLGYAVGLLSLALVAANPTFLAHASLATTDGMAAQTFAVAACELYGFLEAAGRWRLVRLSLAVGAALLAKFSAGVHVALLLGIALVAAARGWGRYRGAALGRRLAAAARAWAVVAVLSCVVVNGGYRFQRTFWTVERILAEPEPQNHVSDGFGGRLLEARTPLARLPKQAVVPVPYTYVFGAAMVGVHATGGHATYLMGQSYRGGRPWYFPLVMYAKLPSVFWVAVAVGIRRAFRERASVPVFCASVAALFLATILFAQLNIGVRHALPLVPPLAVVGGWGLVRWLEVRARRDAAGIRRVAIAASILLAALPLAAAPGLLGYFGLQAGTERTQRFISVIGDDWGQDARRLGLWARTRGVDRIYYRPAGKAGTYEIERIGVQALAYRCGDRLDGPGWLAAHDSVVKRSRVCREWLGREPDAWIMNHVRVYALPIGARAAPLSDDGALPLEP
jgi:hypothetical protein